MVYQKLTIKPVKTSRQTNKQKTSNRNNFSDQTYIFSQNPKHLTPYMNIQSQSQAQNIHQNVSQQASYTVFFNDQPRATMDRNEIYPFFQQNKKKANKHHTRNQPHYSEDGEYNSQNPQRFSTNQQNKNWNINQKDPIYQSDLFEPFTKRTNTTNKT